MGLGAPFPDHPLAAPSGQERPQGLGAEAPARRGASLGVFPRAGSESPTGWGWGGPARQLGSSGSSLRVLLPPQLGKRKLKPTERGGWGEMPATEQQLWVTYEQGPRRCRGSRLRPAVPDPEEAVLALAPPWPHQALTAASLGLSWGHSQTWPSKVTLLSGEGQQAPRTEAAPARFLPRGQEAWPDRAPACQIPQAVACELGRGGGRVSPRDPVGGSRAPGLPGAQSQLRPSPCRGNCPWGPRPPRAGGGGMSWPGS